MFQSFFKQARPRPFRYNFRYYTPEAEDEKRIKFKRIRKSPQIKRNSVLRLFTLFFILLLIFIYMQKKAGRGTNTASPSSDTIIVEEVIVVE